MLPEQEPPVTERGVIKWVRENLFSSWLNIILTVLSVYVIWWLLSGIVPWLFNSIWVADSLNHCREILAEKGLGSHDGGCFAVITERWQQLLFGFYPAEGYWRPVLALVLFLVAISPVLFDKLPRQMLWFTAISPIVIFALLWGGSIWGPIAVALGVVLGYLALRFLSPISGLLGVIAAILVPILYWLTLAGPVAGALTSVMPIGLEYVPSKDFGGFTLSVTIGIVSIILSLPLGILLALARQSDLFIIKTTSVVFIEVIRGVPLIVWLFTASLLLNYFLPPGTNFDLMLRVIIMVTLFSSAYIAEVIRGGLAALPRGQYEAADSLGLDYAQSMRLIILPQALKISIPGIVNVAVGLFKDTTLVSIISMFDLVGMIRGPILASTEWNGVYWELFGFAAFLFFIVCYGISQYSQWLERQLATDHR